MSSFIETSLTIIFVVMVGAIAIDLFCNRP
jgi:hypothetical protein